MASYSFDVTENVLTGTRRPAQITMAPDDPYVMVMRSTITLSSHGRPKSPILSPRGSPAQRWRLMEYPSDEEYEEKYESEQEDDDPQDEEENDDPQDEEEDDPQEEEMPDDDGLPAHSAHAEEPDSLIHLIGTKQST